MARREKRLVERRFSKLGATAFSGIEEVSTWGRGTLYMCADRSSQSTVPPSFVFRYGAAADVRFAEASTTARVEVMQSLVGGAQVVVGDP